MLIFLGFLLIFLFGYLIVMSVFDQVSAGEKFSLAFGFGLGFLTLLMFYLSRLGLSLTVVNIFVPLIFLIFILKFSFLREKSLFFKERLSFQKIALMVVSLTLLTAVLFIFNKMRISLFRPAMLIPACALTIAILGAVWFKKAETALYLIATLLIFCFLGLVLSGIYWPINEWDSFALYDMRGKIFFWQQSISLSPDLQNFRYLIGYPYLTSIAHAFVYLLGGENPKFIYPLFYGALLLTFLSFLKKETSLLISLFFTLILGTTYMVLEQGSTSYTNLPFAFYQLTGALFLYRFLKTKKTGNLLISSMSLGLSAWTRPVSEPFFLACLLVLLLFSFRKILFPFLFTFIYLLIGYPWQIYANKLSSESTYDLVWLTKQSQTALLLHPGNLLNFSALGKVLQSFIVDLTDFKLYGAGGILFFLFIFLNIQMIKKERHLFLLILFNLLLWIGLIFGLGVMASFSQSWNDLLQDSMARVFLGIYPLLLFYVAKTDLIGEIFGKEINGRSK